MRVPKDIRLLVAEYDTLYEELGGNPSVERQGRINDRLASIEMLLVSYVRHLCRESAP